MSSHNRRTHIDMRSCWALLLLGCSLWLATAAVAEVSEPRDVDPAGLAHGAGDGPPPAAPADSSGSSVVLPILGFSPDSGFLLGGMLLRFFQLDPPESPSRTSVFSPVLMYTTRNQILTFLGTELNWGQNRWQAGLVPGYMKMPRSVLGHRPRHP